MAFCKKRLQGRGFRACPQTVRLQSEKYDRSLDFRCGNVHSNKHLEILEGYTLERENSRPTAKSSKPCSSKPRNPKPPKLATLRHRTQAQGPPALNPEALHKERAKTLGFQDAGLFQLAGSL